MELHWTYLSLHKRILWNNAVVKNKQTEMQDPKLLKICKSEEMLKDMRLLYMPEDIIPLFWSAFGQERCSFTWSRKQLNFTKSILVLYLCGIAIVHFRTSRSKSASWCRKSQRQGRKQIKVRCTIDIKFPLRYLFLQSSAIKICLNNIYYK